MLVVADRTRWGGGTARYTARGRIQQLSRTPRRPPTPVVQYRTHTHTTSTPQHRPLELTTPPPLIALLASLLWYCHSNTTSNTQH